MPLLFVAGILESIASALNTLFIQHRKQKPLFFNSFFLIFVWVYVVKYVGILDVAGCAWLAFVYGAGYAVGNLTAIRMHDKFDSFIGRRKK